MLDLAAPLTEAAAALEASGLGAAMRGSLYPYVNLAHLAGLVLLVGGIGILDLRVIGFGHTIPLPALSRMLTPLAIFGLVLMVGSGVLMFSADATPLLRSPVFQWKLALIAIATINALLFRRLFGHLRREPPPPARLMALASIGLWLTAAALGRLIGYT